MLIELHNLQVQVDSSSYYIRVIDQLGFIAEFLQINSVVIVSFKNTSDTLASSMSHQSQFSTQQSFQMSRIDPEIRKLLHGLNDSLGKLVSNVRSRFTQIGSKQEQAQQHKALMQQQMHMMQKTMEKGFKMQEQRNLEDRQLLGDMHKCLKQTLARIDQPEEVHHKSKQNLSFVAKEAYISPVVSSLGALKSDSLLPHWSESSTKRNLSSLGLEAQDYLQNFKVKKFINKANEKLDDMEICAKTDDQFSQFANKFIDFAKIAVGKSKHITLTEKILLQFFQLSVIERCRQFWLLKNFK